MIKSFCKLNLSLRVTNQKINKLHNIQTNTVLIDLCDKIKIEKIKKKKDEIRFSGIFSKQINNNNNSVTKVLSILRAQKIIKNNDRYKVEIIKNVPVFAGLGGGTSNAAFLIKYFFKKKFSMDTIKNFENKIGTDLRLFIHNQSFQKNIYTIKKYKKKFNFPFLLVYPNIKCSTKYIYSKVKSFSKPSKIDYSKNTSKAKLIKLLKNEKNDLQKVASLQSSKIQDIIDYISKAKGCYFSRMTGSGSVCFGLFKSKKTAVKGLKSIKKKFPYYWCVVTKTI